ncbi:MAG: glycosyltransferase [Peptococcaceae bacterium]|nr:glycosyltransferase [Peptococcaceae bacterium]
MATLSVCLIIKNEENCLYRCLSSIKTIADEIIVVDTGSTDNSIRIALEFGAQVFYSEWENDFSSARNYGLTKANCDWILIIDADEEMDMKCLHLVKKKIEDPNTEAYFVTLSPSDHSQPEFIDIFSLQLRLFRNNPNYRFRDFIHEQVLDSILESNPLAMIKTAEEIIIIHRGSNWEDNSGECRLKRNVNLIDLVFPGKNKLFFKDFLLGREYYRHYKYGEALKHLKLAYENQSEGSKDIPELLSLIIVCLYKLGKMSEALTFLNNVLIITPGSADLYYLKGIIYLTLGLYREAYQSLESALSSYPGPPYRDIIYYRAKYTCQYLLGCLAEYFMDMDNALVYYLESLKNNPYLVASLHRIITILNPRKNPDYTVDSLNRVFDLSDPSLQVELASIFYAEGAYQLALDYLEKFEGNRQISEKTMLLKGLCLLRLKKFPEFEEVLQKITQSTELFINAGQYLLFYHRVIKNSPLALEYLKQIKNAGADPTTLYVLNLITCNPANNSGIDLNRAYDLAKEFIELAVEICEENQITQIFNSLGPLLGKRPSRLLAETYYNFAKFELAREEYLSLLRTGQDYPLTVYYLGKIYWTLGDPDSALQYLNRAIKGGLDTPKIRQEKERLSQDLTLKDFKNELSYHIISVN